MRRQTGDIGAIANVCNTDLQEPADDNASAGCDEGFPRTNPQIPRHFSVHDTTAIQQPADTGASPGHRTTTRQEPGTTGATPDSDSQKPTATARRDSDSGFLRRTSRSNPELHVHLPVAVLSRRPRPLHSGPAHRHHRPHQPPQATPARHLRAYSTLTRYSAPTCPTIAVTVALPRPTAVTMPLWSTFTTLGLVLPHTIPSR